MSCEWCGSSNHTSDRCRTRNLVRYLTDSPEYDEDLGLNNVVVMGDEETIDGLRQLSKIRKLEEKEFKC